MLNALTTLGAFKASPLFDTFGALVTPAAEGASNASGAIKLGELPADRVRALVAEHGAVMFRGFAPSLDDFVALSSACSTRALRHTSPSVRKSVTPDGTVYHVLSGKKATTLHGEREYLPGGPDQLWFMCVVPAVAGGETLIADGRAIFRELSLETQTLMATKRLHYRATLAREGWPAIMDEVDQQQAMSAVARMEGVSNVAALGDDCVQFDYVKPGIRYDGFGRPNSFINAISLVRELSHLDPFGQDRATTDRRPFSILTFEDGSPITDALHAELDAVYERTVRFIQWQKGDVVLLDNRRVMHGRRPFQGDREMFTRMCMA